MTPEEIVASWYDSQFNLIDEKAVNDLIQLIQSALAERTEQCAKICDEYTRLGILRSLDATIKSQTAKDIQAKIRALNQPEIKS